MLILTRKVGETIVTGQDDNLSKITILGVNQGIVRIGIDAPKNIPVHRQEVYDRIQRGENKNEQI